MDPQKRTIYYTLYRMDPKTTGYLLHFVQDGSSNNGLFITLCTGCILKNGLFITLCTGWILNNGLFFKLCTG